MNRSDAPTKQYTPFATNGLREPLLQSTPSGDNTASYLDGFPPITMTLKSAGGLPPKGQDMNQILFELGNLSRWASTGALNSFDSALSSAIGGYPAGSCLMGDDGSTIYISSVNNNSANPNTGGAGWINYSKITSIASLSGGADKLPYFTGANTASQTAFTSVGRDIVGQATVSALLTYLGLGTAAIKNVGTSTGQIPDMSSFTANRATTGWQKLPGGLIIQWGQASTNTSSLVAVAYPIPFPNNTFQVVGSCIDVNNANIVAINSTDGVNFNLVAWVATAGSVLRTTTPVKWIAIGN
ncbi:gp53-like domain-containing protein [Enterobacter asburiae]|uniref:gp53-like domain-containing protein n=1 Tax=Enterobacter asburiae TaxID=61645 RepID=UPI0015E93597|nr:phage tail protein [Enterobacter asburiae]QLR28608.1 phage tail protein [Enterobacter asburiae]HDR2644815.1 phage tail protein [Enterobacter asburiae]